MMSKVLRASLQPGEVLPSTIRRVTIAEVSDARMALDDRTAETLQGWILKAANKLAKDFEANPHLGSAEKMMSAGPKLVVAERLIESWVASPQGIWNELIKLDPTEPSA